MMTEWHASDITSLLAIRQVNTPVHGLELRRSKTGTASLSNAGLLLFQCFSTALAVVLNIQAARSAITSARAIFVLAAIILSSFADGRRRPATLTMTTS